MSKLLSWGLFFVVTSAKLYGATLTLSNTTHPTLSPYLFYLNDKVQVTATGNNGDQITVRTGTSVATLGAPVYFATIPAGGNYSSTPTAESTAGVFYQQWLVAGVPMGNAIAVIVTNTPVAVFTSVSHPGLLPNFEQNDGFTLNVIGLPNSTVYAASGKNGAVLGTPVNVGTTDSTGIKQFPGTFDSTTVGNWVEQWCVSSTSICTTINFSVVTAKSKDYVYLGGRIAAIENN